MMMMPTMMMMTVMVVMTVVIIMMMAVVVVAAAATMVNGSVCPQAAMPTAPVVRAANIFADMFRVDLSNADVIFVNNVAFDETLNAKLLRKIHFNTRPGRVVVRFVFGSDP